MFHSVMAQSDISNYQSAETDGFHRLTLTLTLNKQGDDVLCGAKVIVGSAGVGVRAATSSCEGEGQMGVALYLTGHTSILLTQNHVFASPLQSQVGAGPTTGLTVKGHGLALIHSQSLVAGHRQCCVGGWIWER